MKKLIVLILLFPTVVFAVGAPDYYPDGAHPRLYLDATTKTELLSFVSGNTTEWAEFKSWCDTHIGENVNSGYQGAQWATYARNYALCYQMTGVESYAAESVIYLEAMLDDNVSSSNGVIGDNGGGADSIQTDSGYTARIIGAIVPLTRDWLDGSSALTASIISRVNLRMDDWITWYSTSGYKRDGPEDNYYAGYFEMVYNTAFALYGDPDYQSNWLTQMRTMWSSEVQPIINGGEFDPADSMEGWSYYPYHARSFIQYPVLEEQAAGKDIWSETGGWETKILNSVIHMLRPDRLTMFDDGVWDSTAASGVSDSSDLINFLGTFTPLSQNKKGIARWYIENLGARRNSPNPYYEFLYARPTEPTTEPDETNMSGLYYQTKGNVIGRSATWTNTNATWFSVTAWTTPDLSEGGRSAGELKIHSRGEYLLPDGTYASYAGEYSNVVSATGSHRYAPYQDWDGENITTTVTTSGNNKIIKVSGLESVYSTQYYGTTLSSYARTIVYLPDDVFVVFDNAVPVTTSDIKRRWFFFGNPSVVGPTITSTHTNAALSVWTDGVINPAVGPNSGYPWREGTYYIDVNGDGKTVFQCGENGFAAATVTDTSSGDNWGVSVGGVKVTLNTLSNEVTIQNTTSPTLNAGQDQTGSTNSATINGIYTIEAGRTVSSCTWSNDRGGSGSLTASNNTITGTITGLSVGANVITITLTDSEGESVQDTITITYTVPASTPVNFSGKFLGKMR